MNQLEQDIIEMAMYKIACYDEGMEKTGVSKLKHIAAKINRSMNESKFYKQINDLTKSVGGSVDAFRDKLDLGSLPNIGAKNKKW